MDTAAIERAAQGSLQNTHEGLTTPKAHNAFLDSLQVQIPQDELDLDPYRAQLLELEVFPAADQDQEPGITTTPDHEPEPELQEDPLEVPGAPMDGIPADSSPA